MHCTRPGCTGTIEDGYCNVCGMAPEASPPAASTVPSPSSAPSRMTSLSTRTGSGLTTSRRTASGRSRRGNLGAGLVEVPPVPPKDPSSIVLAHPEVVEAKRVCGKCGQLVGQTRDGKPGRPSGFCPRCGTPFNFEPKLRQGDLVADQYEVVGCIAHGGLGWIYLAKDQHVSDRWVVLKGLLDSGDQDAMEAAIAERRFLAEMEHPNIVKIFNFVQHDGLGYIVMEYVGGKTLKDIRVEQRAQTNQPLPAGQAVAYILEMLPAFAYMHGKGLLYNDFKPENVKQTDEQLKLIDLGAVMQMDDADAGIFGTVGYQAPEVAQRGVSVASDIYTLGRTLAVLTVDFKFSTDYVSSLPPPAEAPAFSRYESFYRLLVKATDPDPDLRFTSADEMREQLLGVLHEVVAVDGAAGQPVRSKLFSTEFPAHPDVAESSALPVPIVDPDDPDAGLLASVVTATPVKAAQVLDQLTQSLGNDWRIAWWRGILALHTQDWGTAVGCFDGVYGALPGELAPKLALACAHELAGNPTSAIPYYTLVAATDQNSATASFGLARTRLATGDRDGAADALRRIPATSSAAAQAQVMLCHVLSIDINGSGPHLHDLQLADQAIAQLNADVETRIALTRGLLQSALDQLRDGVFTPDGNVHLAGVSLSERGIRQGLEKACRELARYAPTRAEQIALIDQANQYRPLTLL